MDDSLGGRIFEETVSLNLLKTRKAKRAMDDNSATVSAARPRPVICGAPVSKSVILERVSLYPDVKMIYDKYRELRDRGVVTNNAVRLHDYKRWSIVYERIIGHRTLIDVGIGLGQLVNCAALSGRFDNVIGADFRPHSGLQRLSNFKEVRLNLTQQLQDDSLQADVVTCLEVIEHLPPDLVPLAIENLRKIARKRLIVTVPYEELPLPTYHRQSFSYGSLSQLFDGAEITLIVEGRFARWAMVDIDLSGAGASAYP